MRGAWLIARRELRERTAKTGYRVTTALGLLLIVGLFLLPTIKHAIDNGSRTKIAVVDPGARHTAQIQRALPERAPNGKPEIELHAVDDAAQARRLVSAGKADGTLTLSPSPVYAAKSPGDEVNRLRQAVSSAFARERLARLGLDDTQLRGAFAPVHVRVDDTGGKTASDDSRALVYALLLMLYMSILVYGAAASAAIVQEKTSRVTEVMLSRVSPLAHMTGKLGGLGIAGLAQYAVWIGGGLIILAASHVAGADAGIDLANVPAGTLVAFGVFFVLGFALYGTLYAALSAPASRLEDASAAGTLPGILIVVSFIAAGAVLGKPDGSLAQVVSLIPPLAPMTMFTRVALSSPPWYEVAASVGALLLTIALVLILAAKVYRVGLLLYGTKPRLRTVLRLVRQS